ncbi:MAG: hypothetical protein QXF01_00620 [Candidatus Micrarchaeaceae archaeon]
MITGLEVTKVEANRKTSENIGNMKFNINFEDVKVDKENVTVGFTFSAIYEGEGAKEVGNLKISGNLFSKEAKKDADEIASTWKEKNTLPLKYAEDVINILNFQCGARGTLVAYSIGFAAPLPFSRAKIEPTS